MKDKIQIAVAVLLAVAGFALFYKFSDKPMIARVGMLLGCFIAGGVVAWFTQPGKEFALYASESIDEAKLVIWPTKEETMKTTGVIFVFVVIMALFLGLVDWSLTFMLSKFIGGA